MSRDGWLPPGVSHEDVERAAGAWDEETDSDVDPEEEERLALEEGKAMVWDEGKQEAVALSGTGDNDYSPGFYVSHESWYRDSVKGKRILIGLYDPDRGRTPGEFSIEWVALAGQEAPQLRVFDDGWAALKQIDDVHGLIAALALLNKTNPGSDEVKALLLSIGIPDLTPYVDPEDEG